MNRKYKIPKGCRVYAVGDIHGQMEMLERLHEKIDQDIATQPEIERVQVVYLGDYIDRGSDSRGVVQCILDRELEVAKVEPVYIEGNHESGIKGFMKDPNGVRRDWLEWGGIETLQSYGVKMTHSFDDLALDLKQSLPHSHHEFLRNLKPYYALGDYVFVHAGIRPGIKKMEKQEFSDLISIRAGFLDNSDMHKWRVVHGHTITDSMQVEIFPNRIAVDTGAYKGGPLSCVVLEKNEVRVLEACS